MVLGKGNAKMCVYVVTECGCMKSEIDGWDSRKTITLRTERADA